MAKFGKFLLTTAAIVGTVATAYGIYKYKDTFLKAVSDDDDDEDYDDFSEEEDNEANKPHYVPLNTEPTVGEAVKETVTNAASVAEDVAEDVADVVEEVVENASDAVEEVVETAREAADNFSPLPEQMAVEESVEEFFNDEL